ncbi:MAG: hypothetical protein WC169_11030 [Dehalococcoidia bacterium]|jgi:hypothetical protein
MSILWAVCGFILCLFMPQSVQMVAKNLIMVGFNKVKAIINKKED